MSTILLCSAPQLHHTKVLAMIDLQGYQSFWSWQTMYQPFLISLNVNSLHVPIWCNLRLPNVYGITCNCQRQNKINDKFAESTVCLVLLLCKNDSGPSKIFWMGKFV